MGLASRWLRQKGRMAMNRTTRWALAAFSVALAGAGPARAFCIWGFGTSCEPANPLVGEYTLDRYPATTLTVTPRKITSRTGPVSFSVDYTIKTVDGNNIAIEVGPPEPKKTVQVQLEKDRIKIFDADLFPGNWRKKAAGR
jgi:hypothetical protein